MVSQYLFYQANMFCFQALAPICAMETSIDEQRQFSQWYVVQFLFFFFLFAHQIVCVGTTQCVTIPAVTPTFSSTSCPATSPEVPRDISSSHVPLGSHMIHPRVPLSRPIPREPVSRPRWVRFRESPPSTPDAPDEPESSADPWIDSAAMTEDLTILQGLLSGLPMSLC